jgi:hypothetical protein
MLFVGDFSIRKTENLTLSLYSSALPVAPRCQHVPNPRKRDEVSVGPRFVVAVDERYTFLPVVPNFPSVAVLPCS